MQARWLHFSQQIPKKIKIQTLIIDYDIQYENKTSLVLKFASECCGNTVVSIAFQ